MSLIDEIRIAQRAAAEAAVIRNLERQGLGGVGGYATAEESASVMREATPDEKWLHAQLDRIDPHRHEMGSAGDTPALVKLVFELRDRLKSQPAQQHPDDVAVARFADAMKAKMAKQRAKGYGGWDDPAACPTERLQLMMMDHIAKGDPVDVGNFAMMLYCRGDATAKLERNPS